MDGKSRSANNIIIERWFRRLKTELIYINEFTSPGELRWDNQSYVEDYNSLWPHEARRQKQYIIRAFALPARQPRLSWYIQQW